MYELNRRYSTITAVSSNRKRVVRSCQEVFSRSRDEAEGKREISLFRSDEEPPLNHCDEAEGKREIRL